MAGFFMLTGLTLVAGQAYLARFLRIFWPAAKGQTVN